MRTLNLPLWNWGCLVLILLAWGYSYWYSFAGIIRKWWQNRRESRRKQIQAHEAELAALWEAHERRAARQQPTAPSK